MRTFFAIVAALAATPAAGVAATAEPQEVVLVVFPFTSPDDAEAGRQFGDHLRLRAKRLSLVVVDPLSVKEAMGGRSMPTLETSADAVGELITERFGAQLALWGEVERAGSDLKIEVRGVDVRSDPLRFIVEHRQALTPQNVGAVQDRILEKLSGRAKKKPPEATPEADAKVPTVGENLVANAGFEAGDKSPDGWQRIDGLTTFWVAGERPTGKRVRFDTNVYHSQWKAWQEKYKAGATADEAPAKVPTSGPKYDTVAGLYGVAYFSDPIAVRPGTSYKVEVDYRGKSVLGGAVEFFPKLFIRGYGEVAGEKRVVYDAYLALRCKTQAKEWEHNVRIITIPTDMRTPVEFVRLMLYAYWPPDLYWFDNVTMKEVAAPASKGKE